MIRSSIVFAAMAVVLPVAACASAQEAPAAADSRSAASAPVAAHTLDTPIERLVADPAAKTVLDRELPGLTTHARYDQFKGMSLKALKPFSGGLITDERLAAVEAGLRALASER
ncbi:MAG: hypothetical protein DI624_06485 [Brevundimonas sp.]|uniref:hypothetical protein n=1 Tax=Brevundimonas sp. TaxID=1871086 RepID=UPI000DB3425C|nr:hypothetical protein [Brevundimonas sp.]PZT98999.1 MAG: hypothetical protein DI624_06485 [Brevundimonas sp.]